MKHEPATNSAVRRPLLAAVLAVGLGLAAGTAAAAEGKNPDADEILRSMSKFLAGTPAFSVVADVSLEFMTVDAEKLQLNSRASLVVERPARIHATRQGRFADTELFYDGSQLTIYGKDLKAYVQQDVRGTIDQAIAALETATGFSMPGADLLLADPYAVLSAGVTSSGYHGLAVVGGIKAHHLAFRTPSVDWQIWVQDGEQPLPLKYVITTKRLAGAPQYSVQMSQWNLKPAIPAGRFRFVAPPGVEKLPALPVDETGEPKIAEEARK
jgi:hypothetical protein